jgi:Right handed beta helix region
VLAGVIVILAASLLLVPGEAADVARGPRPLEAGGSSSPTAATARPTHGSGFLPMADATVEAMSPRATDGNSKSLRSSAWPETRSYLGFEIPEFSGDVTKAVLALRALKGTHSGFEVYLAEGQWQEQSVTFANAPSLTRVLDSSGSVERGDLVRLNVTQAVERSGVITLAIVTSGRHPVSVASRESGHPAVLSAATGRWCRGMMIRPGESIQSAIDKHGEGTTFCLLAGVHRLRERLYPLDRQRFVGEEGAILNGSKALTSFRRKDGFWVAEGQRQEFDESIGECKPGYSACALPERVFIDGVSLWQVTSQSELSSGEFYFDHVSNEIYLADDPAGHFVETTVATGAFEGWPGRRVQIRDLIIEKFATSAQDSVVGDVGAQGWTIMENEVRNNSGIGISAGSGTLVRANYVHDQGQMGLSGQNQGADYVNNTVSNNNVDGFAPGWEAGGAKWVGTTGMKVIGNYFFANGGHALWADGNNFRTRYLNNRVEGNRGIGILHEISYNALIRDNYLARNGGSTEAELDGAGIMVASSSSVDVLGNTLVDNADGVVLKQHSTGYGDRGAFVVTEVSVRKNLILMCEGESGAIQTVGDDGAIFEPGNIRFDDNIYVLGPDRSLWWRWWNNFRDSEQWRAFGQDRHSRFRTALCGPGGQKLHFRKRGNMRLDR